MAIAPQNIMSKLRLMPDAELASFARAHQRDPYIFPLAFQESQDRQRLRAAKTAEQTGMQPPKVVQQDLMQMAQATVPAMSAAQQLPEDTGIAQLPAPNMQTVSKASGGIIAFEEGGHIPRYNGVTSDGSQVTVGSDIWDPTTGEWVSGDTAPGPVTKWLAEKVGWKKGLSIDPAGGLKPLKNEGSEKLNADRDAAMAQVNAANYTRPGMQDDPRLAQGYKLPSGITSDSTAIAPASDTGTGKTKGASGIAKLNPATPSAGKTTAAQAATPAGLGSLADWAKEANAYTGADPTAKQLARIDKQEAEAAGDKKEAMNMALLKAGLGMMAGRSRYAFENIGKGAMAGAEDYSAAMKDLKKAGLERDRMRDAAEQAAYAYKRDDVKGFRTAQEKLADREADWKRAVLQADTTMRAAQTTAGAHLAAAQLPPKEAQMAAMLGEGKTFEERFQSGLPKLTAIQAGKFDPRKAYTEYLVAAQKSGTGDILSYPEFAMQFAPRVSGDGSGSVLPRKD